MCLNSKYIGAMKKILLVGLSAIICTTYLSQTSQIVRGKVVDKESQYPLDGATISLVNGDNKVISDSEGKFRMEGVPLGRQSIEVEYTFYKTRFVSLIVTAGKEIVLNIDMEDAFTEIEGGVEITARKDGGLNNEMASVSAKSFSVEETDRYAGSRSDPARMASNFAGVQGADDSKNDIVIRGNSPAGVLWRVEGIDIPNPNHFAISGTSGGAVCMLNNKTMSNSDFFTGAFPAEYGNSTAGVFDLKLKNGNNESHEYTWQFGFLGTELMGEGPLSKNTGASYLFAYRYSTVSIFSLLGIDIGTSAVPKYQDLSFKLNFPLKSGANLALFGISGMSDIDILISDQTDPNEVDLYGENDRDQMFGTRMGVFGLTYSKALSEKSFLKSTTAASLQNQHTDHFLVYRHVDSTVSSPVFVLDSTRPLMSYWFTETKFSNFTSINKKFSKKNILKLGLSSDFYLFDFKDSIDNAGNQDWLVRWNYTGTAFMLRPFIQWKHNFNQNTTMNLGIHQTYFSQGNAYSYPEPRVGFNFRLKNNQSINFGAGLHSQIQPTYTYFYLNDYDDSGPTAGNEELGLSRSAQIVLGYDRMLGDNATLKLETYYQYLFGIPVSRTESNSLSIINAGGGFSRFFPTLLDNSGTGRNYGIEMTVERRFHKSYYFMLTGSLYNSFYRGSDGIERNTDFNGNFALNGLFGWEKKLKERNTIGIGTKITWAGGKRYGNIDTLTSNAALEVIFEDEGYNEFQFRDYFRADLKFNYKINGKKKNITHEFAIDLVNLTAQQNILNLTYAPGNPSGSPFVENYQLGRLPIFYYKIDF